MVTAVTGAAGAAVGHTVLSAAVCGIVGSVVKVDETDAVEQTVVTTLYGLVEAILAPQSPVAAVVFVFALVAVAAIAGETVAVFVPAAMGVVLGKFDFVNAVVSVVVTDVSVAQTVLPAAALLVPDAVKQTAAEAVLEVVGRPVEPFG